MKARHIASVALDTQYEGIVPLSLIVFAASDDGLISMVRVAKSVDDDTRILVCTYPVKLL